MRKQFQIQEFGDLRPVMTDVWNCVCRAWEEAADKRGLLVSVQTASKRSVEQNRHMWAILHDIAEQKDWYGMRLTPEEWKSVFWAGLKKQKVVPNLDGTGFVIVGGSTSDMSVKEMAELIELMLAFAAEHEIHLTAPKWMRR